MQTLNPNPTPVYSAFSPAALRGGATHGGRDGPPPGESDRNENEDPSLTLVCAPITKPAASGMTCARRPAGARKPASPTLAEPFPSSSRCSPRPDDRTGRARARLLLLPFLALLLGALSLLAPATAPAQGTTPAAPTSLSVENGDRRLILSWTAPAGTLTGYDVHYTSAKAAMAADGATATGADPSAVWVAVTRSGTTASQTISGLTMGTAYRVRVRAKNANANGAWAFQTGTPAIYGGQVVFEGGDLRRRGSGKP